MLMPDSWVDALIGKLSVTYGAAFLRQYEGIDLTLVREDWRAAMSGFTGNQISYGLANAPERPPNVLQFRAICLRAPAPELKRLALEPTAPPPDVRAKLAELRTTNRGGVAWARKLKAREEGGEKLTQFQREAWRTALRRHDGAVVGREDAGA